MYFGPFKFRKSYFLENWSMYLLFNSLKRFYFDTSPTKNLNYKRKFDHMVIPDKTE